MSDLLELVTYLATQGVGTVAVDLFAGFLPDAADGSTATHLAVFPTGGLASVKAMRAGPGSVAERPGFQFIARGGPWDYAAAYDRAKLAHAKVDGLGRTTMGSTVWQWIEATQEPYLIQRDENQRPWVGFNVIAIKERSS